MNHKILAILIFSLLAATNSQAQFNLGKVLDKVSGKSDGLGENEIVSGLKRP